MQQLGLSLNAVHLHDVFEVRTAAGCLAAEGVCWRPLQSVSCQGMISNCVRQQVLPSDSRRMHWSAGAGIKQQAPPLALASRIGSSSSSAKAL